MKRLLEEHDQITRVAWKYHKEGLTQKEIADKMDISRFKVMDLLSEAKEQGIVEIRINSPFYNCLSIESKLAEKFGLMEAFVVPTPNSNKSADVRKMIAAGGSNYLETLINSGDRIGVGWGQTLFETVKEFPFRADDYKDIKIALMWGGLTSKARSLSPYDVAKNLADKVGGECYYIFAPAIVDSEILKEAILSDQRVQSVFEEARKADKALLGIGQVNLQTSLFQTGYISEKQIKKLKEKGAVGEILGRYFDIDGKAIESEINDLIIGLGLEEISKIDKVVGFAGGEDKIESIYGALKGRYIDVLVTDEVTAEKILEI
jgi:DNA-binding transcriptional regulator LsrR (DeoR family)